MLSVGFQKELITKTRVHIHFKMHFSIYNLQMMTQFTIKIYQTRNCEQRWLLKRKLEGKAISILNFMQIRCFNFITYLN